MKKLILVRHGKSSWEEDLPDAERPLKKRAFKDAGLVLNAFSGFHEKPMQMWSSHATRALDTARIFQKRLEVEDKDFTIKKELYTFEVNSLRELITSCEDDVDTLMVFGHNPAITGVANQLGDQHFGNVPTTGLCLIEFEANKWQEIKDGKTVLYLFPKNLR
ncbi:histidine phosphatase family protein [Salinimicrobium tongyeongense]|jgi:phosphohistidine phosphatase|uniref:Histidine phosphatase family protein n=1 Tax=Salinimicrobium tongyeongense TaxID=2809707 RepID=A0ABY6NS93_9FLAO|nr:histidine phosphatase family protein [Salinimicrobium tongyeongense]UZH55703.1 histidine phosphatase family protein [Salinimicrobium tongyeongense]